MIGVGLTRQVHTRGRKMPKEESEAGNWLIAGYHAMLNTSRWQRSKGADFVFYDPHPGFTDGSAEKHYYMLICDTFQHAMHIVVERGQRNICQVCPPPHPASCSHTKPVLDCLKAIRRVLATPDAAHFWQLNMRGYRETLHAVRHSLLY